MEILSKPALESALQWLANFLKFELRLPDWEAPVESLQEGGAVLYLFPSAWRLPGIDDYVAFSFYWSNDSDGDDPCVQLYLPDRERFPQRNQLLNRVRPHLKRAGFTDHYQGEGDPDPSCPLWRNIRFEFNGKTGIDLSAVLSAILTGFQGLMAVAKHIEEARQALPAAPAPSERKLRVIAFLDTEWTGSEPARKMTELAIVNVAYDPVKDEVVGILEDLNYVKTRGKKLDEVTARALLERAERIVAHNSSGDQSLLDRELPGTGGKKWLCSFRGIDWKHLIGVQSERQEVIMGRVGLRYTQDHHARADAHDLIQLLAHRHDGGRTYLGRLLDGEGRKIS